MCESLVEQFDETKLKIEILESRADSLQAFVNSHEWITSPKNNHVKQIDQLERELCNEKNKTKQLEGDLSAFKRKFYELGEMEQPSIATSKIPNQADVLLNSANNFPVEDNVVGPASTPEQSPFVREVCCIDESFESLLFHSMQGQENIGGPISTLALTNSLDDNEKHANMHNSLEAQLQEYHEKHTLLFEHKRLAKNTQSPRTKRVKLDHGFDNNRKTKSNAASSANQPHRNSEAKHQQQQRRQPRKQHNRRHKFTRNRYGESSENDNNNTNNKNNGNRRKCDGISRDSNKIMYQPPQPSTRVYMSTNNQKSFGHTSTFFRKPPRHHLDKNWFNYLEFVHSVMRS